MRSEGICLNVCRGVDRSLVSSANGQSAMVRAQWWLQTERAKGMSVSWIDTDKMRVELVSIVRRRFEEGHEGSRCSFYSWIQQLYPSSGQCEEDSSLFIHPSHQGERQATLAQCWGNACTA